MAYSQVANTADIPPGSKLKVTLRGLTILIVNHDGSYYAADNKCPHMGGSLYDGKLDGTVVTCPRHGSVFDLATGEVMQPGKLMFVNVKVSDLKRYAVKVEGSDILVEVE